MDVFSMELGIWLSFVKTSEFFLEGELNPHPSSVYHWGGNIKKRDHWNN
jgi:hypothetical protein